MTEPRPPPPPIDFSGELNRDLNRELADPAAPSLAVAAPDRASPPPLQRSSAARGSRASILATPSLPISRALASALLLHAVVFGAALILPRLLGTRPALRRPILARMVALGKPRDQRLLPRKEVPPPSASAPASAPAPAPAPASAPAPAPAPSTSAKTAPRLAPAPKPPPSREALMAQALAGVTRTTEREPKQKPEERVGSTDGSEAGTAPTAEEGDVYFTAVQNAILAQYVLPSIISERERMGLQATVVAWIGGDGSILRHRFERRSGNHFFDDALELAIKRAKVPPPPAGRAREIREEGVALVFTP